MAASAPTPNAQPVPTRDYTPQEKLIIEEIKKQYPDAHNYRFDRIGTEFIDGNTYMVEFITDDIKNKSNSWFYAYADSADCRLFNTGDEAVVFMQGLLEKKSSFLHRIKDFDLVYIVVTTRDAQNAISKEFLAIVSLILGYYFGRNKSK
jgi:hypothetical protein